MSETKHTQGPWINKDGMIYAENDPTGSTIVMGNCKTLDADLKLIAAAPDLLEALKDCKEQLEIYLQGVEDGMDDDAESAYQFACKILSENGA